MAGPIDPTLRKFHASLNVSDLERSIAFYRVLLDAAPAKVRSDYAKFDIAEPPLVLSLIPGSSSAGGALNHVGLRVRGAEDLVAIQRRLEEAGLHTRREDNVECCHATQTKFWITDPDRVLWEIYVFHHDVEEGENGASPELTPSPPVTLHQVNATALQVPRAWQHRLTEPIPARIPYDDNSLHEIRLEGSINANATAANREGLFPDVLRALRPGATLYVHGLSGDRPIGAAPSLPGPAAAVAHVPSTSDVIDELERTGFTQIHIETLSRRAYFVVEGVPLRELRLTARKPGHRPQTATHQAIYLGPLRQVADDFGNVFQRGVATAVNVHDWQVLSKSAARDSFLLLAPEGAMAGASGERSPAPGARSR